MVENPVDSVDLEYDPESECLTTLPGKKIDTIEGLDKAGILMGERHFYNEGTRTSEYMCI